MAKSTDNDRATEPQKDTCNCPDCDRPVKCRGLCVNHYAQHGQTKNAERKAELASLMDPPKRPPASRTKAGKSAASGRRAPSRPRFAEPEPADDYGPTAEPEPPDDRPADRKTIPPREEGAEGRQLIDESRAAADDAFRIMGAKSIRLPNGKGMLYVLAETGRLAFVDARGKIRNAVIHAGAANELVLGRPE